MKINFLQQEKEKMDNNERKKDDSAISNDDMVGKDNFDHWDLYLRGSQPTKFFTYSLPNSLH